MCKQHAPLVADAADLGQRLDGPDLVVGQHHGDEDRVAADGRGHLLRTDAAGLLVRGGDHRQERDLEALAAQPGQRIEHRGVLGGHADQVPALGLVSLGRAAEGQVVALRGAAGEDDLARPAPMAAASFSRASSTASLAAQPKACVVLPALPNSSENTGSIASTTRGSTRVVAWLSM